MQLLNKTLLFFFVCIMSLWSFHNSMSDNLFGKGWYYRLCFVTGHIFCLLQAARILLMFLMDNFIPWAEYFDMIYGFVPVYYTGVALFGEFWDWNYWDNELVAHVYMIVITIFGFFVWYGSEIFSTHILVIFFVFTQNMQKCISTKCNFVSLQMI